MRALIALVLSGLLLAGCVPVGAGQDQAIIEVPLGDVPTDETASTSAAAPEGPVTPVLPQTPPQTAQSAPEPEPEPQPEPEPAPDLTPELVPPTPSEPLAQARARAACVEQGGLFSRRGAGLFACVQQTRDGGRQCRQNSDCQGVCLARSGTCAPFTPLYGCQEVFTGPGRRETLCLE